MINARRSLETKASRQVSQVDIFFLNMTVRRSHLVEDSLKEVKDRRVRVTHLPSV